MEDKDRISGVNDEKWSQWVIPGGEDEYNQIRDPSMQRVVRNLAKRPDALTPPSELLRFYNDVETLLNDGKVTDEEAAPYMDRITRRVEALLGGGEKEINISGSETEQYNAVDRILDEIESSNLDTQGDLTTTHRVTELKASLKEMPPWIQKEVRVRLALHDSSELIKQAGGWIFRPTDKVGYGHNIGSAFTEAERRGHGIDGVVVKTMLSKEEGDRLYGLKTNTAWDVLEDSVYKYKQFVETVNEIRLAESLPNLTTNERTKLTRILEGINYDTEKIFGAKPITAKDKLYYGGGGNWSADREWVSEKFKKENFTNVFLTEDKEWSDDDRELGLVPTNYWVDSNDERKKAVNELMVYLIASDNGTKDVVGEDETRKAKKALQLAEKFAIATLESSVFNQTSMTGNDELAEIIGLKGYRVSRGKAGRARGPQVHLKAIDGFGTSYLRTLKGGSEPSKPLYSYDLELENIGRGGWLKHGTTDVSRINQLRGLLLDRTPSPNKEGGFSYDINFLQDAVVFFSTADKPEAGKKLGPKALKAYWVMGVLDMALAQPKLGWNQEDYYSFYKSLVVEKLSEEQGSFLSEAQWNFICKHINFEQRMRERGYWKYYHSKTQSS